MEYYTASDTNECWLATCGELFSTRYHGISLTQLVVKHAHVSSTTVGSFVSFLGASLSSQCLLNKYIVIHSPFVLGFL